MRKNKKTSPCSASVITSISGDSGSSKDVSRDFLFVILNGKKKYEFTKEHRRKLSEAHKDKKQSQATKDKRSQSLKGKKRPPFSEKWKKNIGLASKNRKCKEETRKKLSEMHKGNKTNFWKGGIDRQVYRHYNNLNYRLWREKVFERDDYTCQTCKAKSGNGKAILLHPHHIKSYTHYPKLRYKISNGTTLCKNCHNNLHWRC